jgi:hypothetical protein
VTQDRRLLIAVFTPDDLDGALTAADAGEAVVVYHGFPKRPALHDNRPYLLWADDCLNWDSLAGLRQGFREAAGGSGGTLDLYLNTAFISIVQPIAALVSALALAVRQWDIAQIKITGRHAPSYLPVFGAEGEVVSHFLWFPELFYPRYALEAAASLDVPARLVPSRAVRRFAWVAGRVRPLAIDSGKLAIKFFRGLQTFGWRYLFLDAIRPKRPAGPVDDVIFIRSAAGFDFLQRYARFLESRGRRVVLAVGEMLQRRSSLRERIEAAFPRMPLVYLPRDEGPLAAVAAFLRNRFERPRLSRGARFDGTIEGASFSLDLARLEQGFLRASFDRHLYRRAVARALDGLDGSGATCVTAELVTHYPVLEGEEARKRGLTLWTAEIGVFDKRNIVRLVGGDFYTTQTRQGEAAARAALPWEADKIRHRGCIAFPDVAPAPLRRFDALRRVVFFTQPKPLDEEMNRTICDRLGALGKELGFDLVIKPHPRDAFDYAGRYDGSGLPVTTVRDRTSESLTLEADLAVSRFSTTLLEALYMGVPYAALLLEPRHRTMAMESLDPELGVRFETIDALEAALRDYRGFTEAHFLGRAAFLARSLAMPLSPLGNELDTNPTP